MHSWPFACQLICIGRRGCAVNLSAKYLWCVVTALAAVAQVPAHAQDSNSAALVGHWRKTTVPFGEPRDENLVLRANGAAAHDTSFIVRPPENAVRVRPLIIREMSRRLIRVLRQSFLPATLRCLGDAVHEY